MTDLFGEIIVTHDDIAAWVAAVAPAFTSSDRAYANYVRAWRVADKVRDAKAAGTFETTLAAGHERRTRLARRFGIRP
ncbi:hypothetical protein [Burkholderia gladioli]|uniref:hypothetical protein n=1 Tax=Burkholderia gladioli TaxID=28095 RepID=UPI001640D0B4|nr:hypothetical protein [Burkholderia gladioli]